MKLARRIARLEARPTAWPVPDRYPESLRLYREARDGAAVCRATRDVLSLLWDLDGRPERAAAVRAGSDEELEAALKTVSEGTRLRLMAAVTAVLGQLEEQEQRAGSEERGSASPPLQEEGGCFTPSAHSPDAAAPTAARGARSPAVRR